MGNVSLQKVYKEWGLHSICTNHIKRRRGRKQSMKHQEENRQETKHEQVIIHGSTFRGNIISTTFKEFICADFLPPCKNIWINLVMEWMLTQLDVDIRATDKSKPLPKCCETVYE
jgi:hypothetical protein